MWVKKTIISPELVLLQVVTFQGVIIFSVLTGTCHYFRKKWYNSSLFLPEKASDLWIVKLLKFYHHHYIDKAVPRWYKQINKQTNKKHQLWSLLKLNFSYNRILSPLTYIFLNAYTEMVTTEYNTTSLRNLLTHFLGNSLQISNLSSLWTKHVALS